jgi:DNA-binding phage protein
MKIYGTWHAFLVEQLAEEEDVGGFLTTVMEEYQIHGNLAIIQLALQYVVEAQGGISEIAEKIDIEPQILSAVLDETKTPNIDTLRTVLKAFGCCLPIGLLGTVNTRIVTATEGSAVAPEVVASKHSLD